MHPEPTPRLPRWLIATLVLLSVAVLINYIDRGNLATAAPLIKDELGLSATELGFLLTAFFISGCRTDRLSPSFQELVTLCKRSHWQLSAGFCEPRLNPILERAPCGFAELSAL